MPVLQNLKYVIPLYRTMAGAAVKINFNTKHLKEGDPLPPFNGKPRVYNLRYCPYAHRVILVLNAKKIEYEVVNIALMDKPNWIFRKSLFGKVPSLEVQDGVSVPESLIISEYLDEVYPQRPLLPKDPVKKALAKVLAESSGPILQVMFSVIKPPHNVTEQQLAAYHNYLKFIEDQLKSAGTKFLGGAEPGFADYMLWPWFERMLLLSQKYEAAKIDTAKYKILSEYLATMIKDPAVSQYLIPDDIHLKYLEVYGQGNKPDYNMLTKE